jgi:hypothetical protein
MLHTFISCAVIGFGTGVGVLGAIIIAATLNYIVDSYARMLNRRATK